MEDTVITINILLSFITIFKHSQPKVYKLLPKIVVFN